MTMSGALLAARISEIEGRRRAAGVAQADFARAAGVSLRTYSRLVAEGDSEKLARQKLSASLDRLDRTLDRLMVATRGDRIESDLVLATHRGFVLALAPDFAVTPEQVAAADPRANLNFDPIWRASRHVAQAAIYLTNTTLGLKQRRLAEILGLTPAAVCLALKAVEDRRDDPTFDACLRRAAELITGRPELSTRP
jgi:transcriptional regulator with XRE-family HTH domain